MFNNFVFDWYREGWVGSKVEYFLLLQLRQYSGGRVVDISLFVDFRSSRSIRLLIMKEGRMQAIPTRENSLGNSFQNTSSQTLWKWLDIFYDDRRYSPVRWWDCFIYIVTVKCEINFKNEGYSGLVLVRTVLIFWLMVLDIRDFRSGIIHWITRYVVWHTRRWGRR